MFDGDFIGDYYRQDIADQLETMLLGEKWGNDYDETIKWFNEGMRYAIMMIRHGMNQDD